MEWGPTMHAEIETYERQGFGASLPLRGPVGLLIVDFVNGFADPEVFGGGNIPAAIANTVPLLAAARERGWAIAHSRIVYADDDADHNIFSIKVPGMLSLKEKTPNSAIVAQLAPRAGELVVRKTVPSAFFGTSLAAWLAQRGIQTLLVAGASPAAAFGPAWSMRCPGASGRWSSRTVSAIARWVRTRQASLTWIRSTRR